MSPQMPGWDESIADLQGSRVFLGLSDILRRSPSANCRPSGKTSMIGVRRIAPEQGASWA
jgi:hypothetical protein